ncbi:S1 family peptidase [Crossiella cryophila]|uniref:Peptidase S1 domain-containing protein n=1 Tax=Crossiella cryophila TaxID=43355 RepID=A0A7W7FWU7_9PSEU|nr:trypsin-like serine protease [Crossiella cryophila]MBB4681891.1 hypothetical protein [Crossiella cryophila]
MRGKTKLLRAAVLALFVCATAATASPAATATPGTTTDATNSATTADTTTGSTTAAADNATIAHPLAPDATAPPAAGDVEPFIVRGSTVTQNIPWIVSLAYNGSHTCTASIIAPRWVLTARHCTQRPVANFTVRVGSLKRSSGGQTAKATRLVNYSGRNDVSLVQLDRDINTTYSRLGAAGSVRVGSADTIYGWGADKSDWSGPLPENLKYATGSVASLGCAGDNTLICVRNNGEVAGGDSGGPIIVNGVQVGVCSIGHKPTQNDGFGGYADITGMRSWIKQISGV